MKLGDLHHGGILMMSFGKPVFKPHFVLKFGGLYFGGVFILMLEEMYEISVSRSAVV